MGKYGPKFTLWPKQQDIYAVICGNPGCLVDEVADILGLAGYEVRAGVKQLKHYRYVRTKKERRRVFDSDLKWKWRWGRVLTLWATEE